ncbi:unnamed protein product [Caenorhabditis auriculariae]|uniref:Malic enzyme n=1 Tax=Caenorhabditis auriculariae TaxID=2777116 RepID=A0A8S1HUI6_9PELO|nr:unnamed protein product [Caenorhabditis auriculariae]
MLSRLNNHSLRGVSTTARASFAGKYDPDLTDPDTLALHKLYRPERTTPSKRGIELLKTPRLNKGMAFSLNERQYLGIHGLLPPAFMTEEQQAYRIMTKLRQQPDNLAKYIQLDSLQDRNEKLFYRVLTDNVKELMPIVYTPTVGHACQKFGFIYRNPKGLYITINDNSISKIHQILANWHTTDIRAIVVTDGERILGLGDLGTYGIGIPVGKLALYVALAGIQPDWCLPVILDVGTDNNELLNDPFYTGLRRKRVRGQEYDTLVDNFMKAATKRFGQDTLIQFEDFGNSNAYRLLDRYKGKYCMFNDDIQGTAAVVVAGLLASTRITKKKLSQDKIVFFGAGGAATGVAEMCVRQMVDEGLSEKDACDRIYMVDIDGLITKSRSATLGERHVKFAKDLPDTKNLLEIVKTVRPGALIGASTVAGAFTEEILKEMSLINPRPIIFALSNPTSKAECTAEAAYRATNGTALFASGSPFDDVEMDGRTFKPGQGNNAYIFPGVALGAVLFRVKHIPDKLFLLAARMVAENVSEKSLYTFSRVYPRLKDIRELSVKIAIEVGHYCYDHNLSTLHPKPEDMEMFVRQQLYSVEYDELINKTYEWPAKDSKHGFPVPNVELHAAVVLAMLMEKNSVTVEVPINIALIKYWGKRDEELILPLNDSVSLTVDALFARTTVTVLKGASEHEVSVNGKLQDLTKSSRYSRLFAEALRQRRKRGHNESESNGSVGVHFKVTSETNFPTCAGLASSAAGFGAIALALQELFSFDDVEANRMARLGSGSACRSMLGGLVRWHAGESDDGLDSYATQLFDESEWPSLRSIVFVFDDMEKKVGSTLGMRRSVETSALLPHRALVVVPQRVEKLSKAFEERDFETLATVIMQDSNQFHAICLDSHPPLKYLSESSWDFMVMVQEFNDSMGAVLAAYTFDAGPNACVFLEKTSVANFIKFANERFCLPQKGLDEVREDYEIDEDLRQNSSAKYAASCVVVSQVGGGPRLISSD